MNQISAHVITCPGRLGDESFRALEVTIDGIQTPFHMIMALPAVSCRALSDQVDVAHLYDVLAGAINAAGVSVPIKIG